MPLHVRDLGDGPPVVLLHPGPGPRRLGVPARRAARWSTPATARCSSTCPGAAARRRRLHAHAQAAAVEELMRELDEPTLLGHSFGGYVAMQHLVDFPGSAARRRRVLHGRRRGGAAGRARGPVRRTCRRTSRRQAAPSSARARCSHARGVPRGVARPDAVLRRRSRRRPCRCSTTSSSSVEAHHEHDFGELHALDALAATDIPVLAIVGAQDRFGTARAPSGSPRPPRAASWSSSRAPATSRSPRRPTATGRR